MKKRLEKSLPVKSNLTLEEQVYFIEKTFKFLDNVKERKLIFNNVKYSGFMNDQYGFFKETNEDILKDESIALKFNPEGIINSENFIEMINFLEDQEFNRLFTINIKEESSSIKDNLMDISKDFSNVLYKPKKEFSFSINSSFLYLFRLNKKTMSKNTYIIVFEKYIIIQLIRKKQKMLLYISI